MIANKEVEDKDNEGSREDPPGVVVNLLHIFQCVHATLLRGRRWRGSLKILYLMDKIMSEFLQFMSYMCKGSHD